MMISSRRAACTVGAMAAMAATPLAAQLTAPRPQMPVAVYDRASQMLPTSANQLVLRDRIMPMWIGKTDRFWYRVTTPRGSEFVYVDPAKKLRRPAFDHARLASALAKAADTAVVADSLPFAFLDWQETGTTTRIEFPFRRHMWRCDIGAYACDTVAPPKFDPTALISPNKKWAISIKDHNVWIRSEATGESRALTSDGEARNEYGATTEDNGGHVTGQRAGMPPSPVAIWSPDSRKVLLQKIDQRRVPHSYLLQSVPESGLRPKLWEFAFGFPGDSLPQATWWIFDAESGAATRSQGPVVTAALNPSIYLQYAWWGDSTETTAYYIEAERGAKAWRLWAIDATSGAVRRLGEERGPTLVEPTPDIGGSPNVYVLRGEKQVIWPSERDGWAQLYLMDVSTGQVVRQITKGPFVVRRLLRVDEQAKKLWFVAGAHETGRDPYLMHVYSVNFDGSGLTLLTPEDAQHDVTLGAKGEWVVDRYSRVDLAPVTVLRSLDGKVVLPLESADLTRLLATGWRWPERFTAKAADGVTDIYGVLYKPVDFDSTKKYPVIEEIYPGPQIPKVPKGFQAGGDLHALAELGMVGFEVDGRGTPYRSKAFHDYSYGALENGGGLEDHLAAYKQLAATRPWLDLNRVGIYGHSAGGFASARAIFLYPDFYKVAVSSSGNHDQRAYISLWGERFQGMPNGNNYLAQSNASIAKNLKGRLLLAYGDMDDNVSPALTMQVIDALIRANKRYDLLVVPNGTHAFAANMYFRRRRWDYFAEHLLGAEPPTNYFIKAASELPPVMIGTSPSP